MKTYYVLELPGTSMYLSVAYGRLALTAEANDAVWFEDENTALIYLASLRNMNPLNVEMIDRLEPAALNFDDEGGTWGKVARSIKRAWSSCVRRATATPS